MKRNISTFDYNICFFTVVRVNAWSVQLVGVLVGTWFLVYAPVNQETSEKSAEISILWLPEKTNTMWFWLFWKFLLEVSTLVATILRFQLIFQTSPDSLDTFSRHILTAQKMRKVDCRIIIFKSKMREKIIPKNLIFQVKVITT